MKTSCIEINKEQPEWKVIQVLVQLGFQKAMWYAPNNTVATELRTFDSVEEAELFIKSWLDKGRI